MEELRSTEKLDKEIEDDARKKADRILAKAESEGKNLLESVVTRIEKLTQEQRTLFEKNSADCQSGADATLPLEKERFLVLYVQTEIVKHINDYISSLSKEKRLSLAMARWSRYHALIGAKKMNALVFGFDVGEAKVALEAAGVPLASCGQIAYEKSGVDAIEGFTVNEGIILESEDGMVKCRLALAQIVEELLAEHRAELVAALFGGRFN